jgi:serine/threonine-protein kinase
MIRLRVLGGIELTDSLGRELRAALAQPKRLALLVYLAFHNHHPSRRRDSVVALFWPELDSAHARGALRQALRFLRRELGAGVLNGLSEEEVGFEPAALTCDAVEFEQACDAGRSAEALRLYRGDLLEGFFVSGGSVELEHWIERERARLHGLAAAAAGRLVAEAERAGDVDGAIHAARQALALAPDDEVALMRLIDLLDRNGDRAGALNAFETFRRHLRDAYDMTPSPETRARVQSVRERETPFALAKRAIVAVIAARSRRWLIASLVGVVATTAAAAMWFRGPATTPSNPQLVAVLPFRVSGADSSLHHLSDGMVELMALELTGSAGPQAVAPSAVLELWHRRGPISGAVVAQRLGAGRVLDGGIVGTRERLTIAVTLSPNTGHSAVHASVTGPYDSLRTMVDQLTAQLLAGQAGTPELRLATLTSLPVLRSYLDGRAAFQHGRHAEALQRFTSAVQADSTFAPAALGMRFASLWLNGVDAPRAERLAWTFRDRLSTVDRAFIVADLGPNYPAPYSAGDRVSGLEDLLERYPDMAEGWARLGDLYFHSGASIGVDAPLERARRAFHRALALDSAVGSEGLSHLIEIAGFLSDTAAIGPLLMVTRALDSTAERAEGNEWLAAFTARDIEALAGFRSRISRLHTSTLTKMWGMSQQTGYDVEDAVLAIEALGAREDPDVNPGDVLTSVYELALNRGRPRMAQGVAAAMSPGWSNADRLAVVVLSALYGAGDTAAAAAAVPVLERLAAAPFSREAKRRHDQYEYLCVVQQWYTSHGVVTTAAAALSKLRMPDPTAPPWLIVQNVTCSAAIEAALAASRGRADAGLLVERFDSMVHAGPEWRWSFPRHRFLARLWEARGDTGRALAAVRRRRRPQVRYLASDLREEGRLAAAFGDTAGAVRAYRHYLALRLDPEPTLQPEVDTVRAELARLSARRR